jgi:hypothetical protein
LQLAKIHHGHHHNAGIKPLEADRAYQASADAEGSQTLIVLIQAGVFGIGRQIDDLFAKQFSEVINNRREMMPVMPTLAIENNTFSLAREGFKATIGPPVSQRIQHTRFK